jgi:hypothetical protein
VKSRAGRSGQLRALWPVQHKPLAPRSLDRLVRALVVGQLAPVINEVPLRTLRSEVLPAHMVVDAVVRPPQQRKERLDRVRGDVEVLFLTGIYSFSEWFTVVWLANSGPTR